ncbi:MAG: argininosuccinate synthase [bacterium]
MASKKIEKIVLAYSGGLDTSVMLHWLKKKYKAEIIAVVADVGQGIDADFLTKKAKASGASKIYILDLKKEFVENYIWPSLKAGAIYEKQYLLGTALSRPLIAQKIVEIAHQEKANIVVHGCTGKGNDQVRLELTISYLDPTLTILAPLREWELKTREMEIEYAQKYNIPIEATKKSPYSLDKNLWHLAIESGDLENLEKEPQEDIYQLTTSLNKTPSNSKYLEISFENGIPVKIDDKKYDGVNLIQKLNEIGGKYGIGRVDMIESRLVGIKTREIYESPAGTILYTALSDLETLVLDRETLHYKQLLSLKYADLVYYGLWCSPLREAIDEFMNKLHIRTTGVIRIKLYKGNCCVVGRKSDYSLYRHQLATYGKEDVFDQKLAKGFIELWGMSLKTLGEKKK